MIYVEAILDLVMKACLSSSPISRSMSITLPDGSSVSGSISGGDVITFKGVLWDCKDGWNPFCTKDCRAAK